MNSAIYPKVTLSSPQQNTISNGGTPPIYKVIKVSSEAVGLHCYSAMAKGTKHRKFEMSGNIELISLMSSWI